VVSGKYVGQKVIPGTIFAFFVGARIGNPDNECFWARRGFIAVD
jgi:hypothetical protein